MRIHEIKKINRTRPRKRIGRGGKRGTTSGRGQKGQHSRSGHRIRPAERDIISKFPKLRGEKNKSVSEKAIVVDIARLAKIFAPGEVVSKLSLRKHGIIRDVSKKIKILGSSDITTKLEIEGIPVSSAAREKIEKAGGSIRE